MAFWIILKFRQLDQKLSHFFDANELAWMVEKLRDAKVHAKFVTNMLIWIFSNSPLAA